MKQVLWTIGGLSTAATAWLLFNQGVRRHIKIPIDSAAEQLQQAWGDHHTEA